MQEKIRNLSEKRLKYLIENKIEFYKGNYTYLNSIKEELKEVEAEIKDNNSVYLEDELGDVFWTYLCFLHSLEQEGKISSASKVFDRCYKKYSERVGENADGGNNWQEVKNKQKEQLKIEHNKLYNNDK